MAGSLIKADLTAGFGELGIDPSTGKKIKKLERLRRARISR